MGKNSRISWCDHTWNPWFGGCESRGPECGECYAKREMTRYGWDADKLHIAKKHTFHSPLRWKEPARIFVCSWSDFFLDLVFLPEIRKLAWDVMRQARQHTYIIPTKRPENISEMLPADWGEGWDNVWLLVSAGTQRSLDKWWPPMFWFPAKHRGISAEPLLERLDIWEYLGTPGESLDWVLIGGMSAPSRERARVFPIQSAIDLVEVCAENGIPAFVKQMGTRWAYNTIIQGDKTVYQLGDRKGQRMEWWPEKLRVQEFPDA